MTRATLRNAALGLSLVAMLLSGCSEQPADQPAKPADTKAHDEHPTATDTKLSLEDALKQTPTHNYPGILGVIESLPTDTEKLRIHHQKIPAFINPSTGKKTGMMEMTMPFALAQGVDLAGYAVGDKVKFTLAVWTGLDTTTGFTYRLTAIEKLDPETEIKFGG